MHGHRSLKPKIELSAYDFERHAIRRGVPTFISGAKAAHTQHFLHGCHACGGFLQPVLGHRTRSALAKAIGEFAVIRASPNEACDLVAHGRDLEYAGAPSITVGMAFRTAIRLQEALRRLHVALCKQLSCFFTRLVRLGTIGTELPDKVLRDDQLQ